MSFYKILVVPSSSKIYYVDEMLTISTLHFFLLSVNADFRKEGRHLGLFGAAFLSSGKTHTLNYKTIEKAAIPHLPRYS